MLRGKEFVPVALAAQANGGIVSDERGDELGAGELAALIGMQDFRQAISCADRDNSRKCSLAGAGIEPVRRWHERAVGVATSRHNRDHQAKAHKAIQHG
jgi:hypothetical protein